VTPDDLRSIPLLAGLSDEGLERVGATCAELVAPAGQVLALPDDPGSGMFVILEGEATVEVRSGSFDLGAGEFFGELALLVPEASRVARVRAATDVRCLTIPRDTFLELLEAEPALARVMLEHVARRLVEARSSA
jgi:voltage-gated potassium channel